MNIRILINLLLIINLAVININCMDKKRKSSDDLALISNKKIKLDPDFEAKLAKFKKEKEAINIDITNLPPELQELIAEYLKNDWYLYRVHIKEGDEFTKVVFSSDNNCLLLGDKDHLRIFNIQKKMIYKIEFEKSQKQDNLVITYEKKAIIKEDLLGKHNYIELFNWGGHGYRQFYLDKNYFSKERMINGIFSQSLNGKYLTFACVNFFKIWDISKFKSKDEMTEKNCIITYNIHQNKDERDESNSNIHGIQRLVFSDCSDYLVITGYCDLDPNDYDTYNNICFIYNLKTKSVLDLTNFLDEEDKEDGIRSLAFSHNSKYLAIVQQFCVYIFKNRQDGFE